MDTRTPPTLIRKRWLDGLIEQWQTFIPWSCQWRRNGWFLSSSVFYWESVMWHWTKTEGATSNFPYQLNPAPVSCENNQTSSYLSLCIHFQNVHHIDPDVLVCLLVFPHSERHREPTRSTCAHVGFAAVLPPLTHLKCFREQLLPSVTYFRTFSKVKKWVQTICKAQILRKNITQTQTYQDRSLISWRGLAALVIFLWAVQLTKNKVLKIFNVDVGDLWQSWPDLHISQLSAEAVRKYLVRLTARSEPIFEFVYQERLEIRLFTSRSLHFRENISSTL